VITLASDFGSPYPAAMRGVVLAECDASVVDVTHDFSRQDVRGAAFWLRELLPYFPPAIHCAVVDPGVGTGRRALAIRAGAHALVGPDNGLLLPAARRLAAAADGRPVVYEWADDDPDSATFHGRDVFAPAAAALHEAAADHARGECWTFARTLRDAFADVGAATATEQYEDLRFPDPRIGEGGVAGEVLVVDDFGNVVTNVPGEVLEGHETVRVDGEPVPVVRSYAVRDAGERLVTVGSHDNVELAVNRGRGDEAFGVAPGDPVELAW
jgi:S-adenosylmethionine hydrolase